MRVPMRVPIRPMQVQRKPLLSRKPLHGTSRTPVGRERVVQWADWGVPRKPQRDITAEGNPLTNVAPAIRQTERRS